MCMKLRIGAGTSGQVLFDNTMSNTVSALVVTATLGTAIITAKMLWAQTICGNTAGLS